MPDLFYALAHYLLCIFEDGEWHSDWLKHLPTSMHAGVLTLGENIARLIGA